MKHSHWTKLAIFFISAILLSGCVLEPYDGYRGEGHHEHDRGDHDNHGDRDHDH